MTDFYQPFTVGQWILWTTHGLVRQGQVVHTEGCSMIVRWLDGEEQVFPVVEYAARGLSSRMDVIKRPREALRVQRDAKRGVMSVQRAASSLGTTPKRVRAMLRAGQLRGHQRDGKWVSVELEA
jgi:hypothetical protein